MIRLLARDADGQASIDQIIEGNGVWLNAHGVSRSRLLRYYPQRHALPLTTLVH